MKRLCVDRLAFNSYIYTLVISIALICAKDKNPIQIVI